MSLHVINERSSPLGGLVFISLLIFCLLGTTWSEAESVRSLKYRAKNFYYGIGVRQDFNRALNLYLQAAQMGDSEAQFISGGMYFKGMGVARDFQKAFQFLHEAAQRGTSSPESQRILAQAFLIGVGTPKNYQKALEWYQAAADNGNSEAMNELGYMYFTGNLVETDLKKGGEYFMRAAESGMAIAQYNVGIMYYTGNGVEASDLVKSYAWMNIAATKGHNPAIAARNYLESILSSNELATAHSMTETLLSQQR